MTEDQQSAKAEGGVPSPETTPLAGGDTPAKPRSGFARMKIKVQKLTELYEHLLDDHDTLLTEHDRLQSEYAALEQAFAEVTSLNAELADELRQTKQQRPAPVRFGQLLGGV